MAADRLRTAPVMRAPLRRGGAADPLRFQVPAIGSSNERMPVEHARSTLERQSAGRIDRRDEREFELPAASVYEAILDSANRRREKTALVELLDGEPGGAVDSLTYGELADGINRRANLLASLGLRPGDPVVFLPPSSIAALLAFWATHAAAAAMPVNAFLGASAIADLAREAGARAIVSGGPDQPCGTFDLARRIRQLAPGVAIHLVIDGPADPDCIDLSQAAAGASPARLAEMPSIDGMAACFPTGGTTGAPKIARLSNRNLLVGALSSARSTSMDEDHVVPAGLPLFHVGGGVIGTTRAMILGHTLVLLTAAGYRSPTIVANFWKLAVEHRFTQIITVPTTFRDLLGRYDGERHGIRLATAGASKLPANLVREYRDAIGVELLEGYGMTECAGFCAVNRPGALRAGSGGTAAPSYQMRVVQLGEGNRYLRDCAVGECGSVVVGGPGVFLGYTNPELTDQKLIRDMPDGGRWIDAGDLGELDADGYVWISGRAKDLIIRGGHNIDPGPVEEALLDFPGIVDAAVVGMPDERVGELPIAFVQCDRDPDEQQDRIRLHCAERVPDRAGVPMLLVRLDELPRTAMRKIFKPELRRMATQMAVDALDPPAGTRVILEESGRIVVEAAPDLPEPVVVAIQRLALTIRTKEVL